MCDDIYEEPHTFGGFIEKYSKTIKPKRILEFGPGASTRCLRELNPDAEIITIEHLKWYFEKHLPSLEKINVKCLLLSRDNYASPPIKGKFDLIFIDGVMELRVMCAVFAKKHLSKNGIIILHDSQRPILKPIFDMFDVIEEDITFIKDAGWDVKTTVFKRKGT